MSGSNCDDWNHCECVDVLYERISELCSLKRQALMTMKIIHGQYWDLMADADCILLQQMMEDLEDD